MFDKIDLGEKIIPVSPVIRGKRVERQEKIQEERRFRQQYVTAKKKKEKKEGGQSEQQLTGKEGSTLDSGPFDSEVKGIIPGPGQESIEENGLEQENAVKRRLINIHV